MQVNYDIEDIDGDGDDDMIIDLNTKELGISEDDVEEKITGQNNGGAYFKGKDSVTRGIDFMKSQRWIIDDSKCPRTAQEVQQYHWKKDKDDNVTDKPVDLFDDAIKAHMYALESLSRSKGKPSMFAGKLSDGKKEMIEVKKAERKKVRDVLKAQRKERREERRRNKDVDNTN